MLRLPEGHCTVPTARRRLVEGLGDGTHPRLDQRYLVRQHLPIYVNFRATQITTLSEAAGAKTHDVHVVTVGLEIVTHHRRYAINF